MKLKDKVAIVTGGGSGIGKETGKIFALNGAAVLITDLQLASAEETVAEINKVCGKAIPFQCDVTKFTDVSQMVKEIIESFGRIDILVNNAGGVFQVPLTRGIEEVTEEDWERVIALNLKGTFLCCKAVIPYMRRVGRGKIVNVSSAAARRIHNGPSGRLAYTSAKAGLEGLTRALAIEEGGNGIYVNAVAPGFTLSSERLKRIFNGMSEKEKELRLSQIPLKRFGTPRDIANVILFLVSDDSDYITGAIIDVSGGRL
jgi:NAD(P)-dependent dehydrogenase (short-subunit alcohol dehydrogenase family)